MDARLAADPAHTDAMNALSENVYDNAVEAADAADAALASENAAASSAGNADLSKTASAGSAAAAQAAAAALQAGLPAQASTNGLVLASVRGVATWGSRRGRSTQIAYSSASENAIANSSAANCGSWSKGPNTPTIASLQTTPGPNGLFSVEQTNTASTNAYAQFLYTPAQSFSKTLSVWYRAGGSSGYTKPSTGYLLYLQYRDAGNVVQFVGLPFSDPSIIADGAWRRYSVTATHAGSTVTALNALICADTGNTVQNWADPQIDPGTVPTTYVGTGPLHACELNHSFDVSSVNGAMTCFLPANTLFPPADTWVEFKDYGRAASTNAITVNRNGSLIEGAANDVEIDINGASVAFVVNARRGWIIK